MTTAQRPPAALPPQGGTVADEVGPAGSGDPHGRLGVLELLFGVALPVVCLWMDPGVFATSDEMAFGSDPVFPHAHAAAWVFVLLEAGALVLYAARRTWPPAAHAFFGGLFLVGTLAAFGIGVIFLPLTALAIVTAHVRGLQGMVPLAMAVVLLRRGVGALGCGDVTRGRVAPLALLLGMAVAAGLPLAVWCAGAS